MGHMTIGNRSVGAASVGNETVTKIFLGNDVVYIYDNFPVEDSVPYLFRKTGGTKSVGDKKKMKIVGATMAWNQYVSTNKITIAPGTYANTTSSGVINLITTHKYLVFVDNDELTIRFRNTGIGYTGDSKTAQIMTVSTTDASYFLQATGTSTKESHQNVIDLTLVLGPTIADYVYSLGSSDGIAWLKDHGFFTEDYYAYDAGSLQSVCVSEHNTTGLNQWDEEWEVGMINTSTGNNQSDSGCYRSKNFIRILPGVDYYFHVKTSVSGQTIRCCFYDENKTFISSPSYLTNAVYTVPGNAAYCRFYSRVSPTEYNGGICINISGSRNGEYEPYKKNSYSLDHSVDLRGVYKLDASNNLYAVGDTYESDGTVTRKYGIVDLSTVEWDYPTTNRIRCLLSNCKIPQSGTVKPNVVCNGYVPVPANTTLSNGQLAILSGGYCIFYFDGTVPTGNLVYELETATEETADPFTNPLDVDPDGTEEFVDYPESQGTRDVEIPVGHVSNYRALS